MLISRTFSLCSDKHSGYSIPLEASTSDVMFLQYTLQKVLSLGNKDQPHPDQFLENISSSVNLDGVHPQSPIHSFSEYAFFVIRLRSHTRFQAHTIPKPVHKVQARYEITISLFSDFYK